MFVNLNSPVKLRMIRFSVPRLTQHKDIEKPALMISKAKQLALSFIHAPKRVRFHSPQPFIFSEVGRSLACPVDPRRIYTGYPATQYQNTKILSHRFILGKC